MLNGFENLRLLVGNADSCDDYENAKLLREVLKELEDDTDGFKKALATLVNLEENGCIDCDICPNCGEVLAFVKSEVSYAPYDSLDVGTDYKDGYMKCVGCGAEYY